MNAASFQKKITAIAKKMADVEDDLGPGSPPSPLSSGPGSPPSPLSSGPGSPPSPVSPRLSSFDRCEDPPLLPLAHASGPLPPPPPSSSSSSVPSSRSSSACESLLLSFSLSQVFVWLLLETDASSPRGLGLMGCFLAAWLFAGLFSVARCPVRSVAKALLGLAVLALFCCSWIVSFVVLLCCGAVVGLLAMPPWMVLSVDMLCLMVQKHKSNRS